MKKNKSIQNYKKIKNYKQNKKDKISENPKKSQKISKNHFFERKKNLKKFFFAEKRLVFDQSSSVQPVSESRQTKEILVSNFGLFL